MYHAERCHRRQDSRGVPLQRIRVSDVGGRITARVGMQYDSLMKRSTLKLTICGKTFPCTFGNEARPCHRSKPRRAAVRYGQRHGSAIRPDLYLLSRILMDHDDEDS